MFLAQKKTRSHWIFYLLPLCQGTLKLMLLGTTSGPPLRSSPPKGWRVAVFNPPWCKKFLEGNGEGDFFPKPLMLPSSQSPKYEWPVKVHQHFRGTVAVQDARCITKGTII